MVLCIHPGLQDLESHVPFRSLGRLLRHSDHEIGSTCLGDGSRDLGEADVVHVHRLPIPLGCSPHGKPSLLSHASQLMSDLGEDHVLILVSRMAHERVQVVEENHSWWKSFGIHRFDGSSHVVDTGRTMQVVLDEEGPRLLLDRLHLALELVRSLDDLFLRPSCEDLIDASSDLLLGLVLERQVQRVVPCCYCVRSDVAECLGFSSSRWSHQDAQLSGAHPSPESVLVQTGRESRGDEPLPDPSLTVSYGSEVGVNLPGLAPQVDSVIELVPDDRQPLEPLRIGQEIDSQLQSPLGYPPLKELDDGPLCACWRHRPDPGEDHPYLRHDVFVVVGLGVLQQVAQSDLLHGSLAVFLERLSDSLPDDPGRLGREETLPHVGTVLVPVVTSSCVVEEPQFDG